MNNKKKVLLLLAGQLRTFDNKYVINGWNKFYEKYDVTTYICCWDNRGRSILAKKNNINDFIEEDENVTFEQVKKIFKTDNIKFYNYNNWINGEEFKDWMGQFINDPFFNCIFAAYYLRNKVYNFAIENIKDKKFDGVFLRPDSFFLREPPDYPFEENEYLWQENSYQNFFPNRIYDNFLFSNLETIGKICQMYVSDNLLPAIQNNFGTPLHFLDSCKVVYTYAILEKIDHKSYDLLYSEPFRYDQDIVEHQQKFNFGQKLWCEL